MSVERTAAAVASRLVASSRLLERVRTAITQITLDGSVHSNWWAMPVCATEFS